MSSFSFIPRKEFERINKAELPQQIRLSLIADMCRANALTAIKIAGSGHLGSSFSAMDIVIYLYYEEMNTKKLGWTHPDRDIYFSSKGHDVPGLYAILYSLGALTKEKLLKLRRLGGIDGHPDVAIDGIECNSGSLGMGISKAKGMAHAKRMSGHGGRIFVLTGDGELQEGQNFEALQSAPHQGIHDLVVVVDHNKVQSDKRVGDINDLGDLEEKFKSFGWYVKRCDGHDFKQLHNVMRDFVKIADKPKILIADTIKGRGISFMEHPQAIRDGNGLYRWHAGAPDDNSFDLGYMELVNRINKRLAESASSKLELEEIPKQEKKKSGVTNEYVADAFGEALVEVAKERKDIVVLDADLATDCRIRKFEETYPERFIENGIAEQDMVSMAGGLALQGYLPIVNSFAAFLASRANEQIYTNTCEGTRIIYVCHYAGLIPAGPGKSHQSIRDISLFGALPNFEIIQPCNAEETRLALHHCVKVSAKNCVLRLIIGPSPRAIELPDQYELVSGQGAVLKEGEDALIFSYGPVMLNEALKAGELLEKRGFSLQVVNIPWLNQVSREWLGRIINPFKWVYILEDHAPVGGLYDFLLKVLAQEGLLKDRKVECFAVEGFPACGNPQETLAYHNLDGESLANQIVESIT